MSIDLCCPRLHQKTNLLQWCRLMQTLNQLGGKSADGVFI